MGVMIMTVTVTMNNMEKENIIVSACLLGVNCKYNGGHNYCQKVVDLKEKYNLIAICPEVDGGLPIPRIPSEIVNDKVINEAGIDVTNEYNLGAKKALDKALENNVKKDITTGETSETGLPKSNVLYYDLEDNCWCCVRPSGTEPKVKFYMGVKGKSLEDAENKLEELRKSMMELAE